MIPNFIVPIVQNKLYFIADSNPPKDVPNAFYFNIDNDLVYEPYYEDFGPLNIAKIWKFINEVYKIMSNPDYAKNVFFHHTSTNYKKCCNSVLLICAYQIIIMGKTSLEAYKPFENIELKPYRDASYGKCSYKCTVLECLQGLEYAIKLGWFSFKKFDLCEYENYEQLENGDLNWVVPDKLIAFSSPYDTGKDQYGNRLLSPKQFIPVFKKLGVKAVIRLNSSTYDGKKFIQNGIDHHDLYFTDGTPPPMEIVQRFLQIVESTEGVVAVHCKAGLGRTGCLIACYAMKHYKFSAAAFIGWIRICRPGSILGPQQHFLDQSEQVLHKMSQTSQIWKQVRQKVEDEQLEDLQLEMKKVSVKTTQLNEQEVWTAKKGEKGQGSRLVEAKIRNSYQTKTTIPIR